MNEEMITQLHEKWERAACNGMGSCLLEETEFLKLTKETFWLLSNLTSNKEIPNPVARILVLMQEFAVYCWFSGKVHSINMWAIVADILYDFLEGYEQCGSVYPKLKLGDEYNIDFFDFETNTLSDMKIDDEPPF